MIKQYIRKTISFILMGTLFACAGIHSGEKASASLSERVNQFMKASVEGNWGIVYTFYDSGFRKSISKEAFEVYPRKMNMQSYTVDGINLLEGGKRAEVTVSETLSVAQGFIFKGIKQKQTWALEGRQWVLIVPPAANPIQK